jgi:adenylate kinase family enzyme/N-acetylglutamate synthase-like GNAT family acetyltransferase
MNKPTRINVIGTSGTGKSTFARKLSERLGCQHIEMDKVFWGPNWHWPPDEVFFGNLRKALSQDKWVLDGNYTRTIPIKWERIEMVVWLDYSFALTLFQAVKRALKRSMTQEELWEGTGNRESFRKSFFSKDSIILWTIKTHRSVRTKYESYMRDPKYSHIKFVRLKNHREADNFLNQFGSIHTQIRIATDEDVSGIRKVIRSSIEGLAHKDYPEEIIQSWGADTPRAQEKQKLAIRESKELTWVAIQDGKVVGFSAFSPQTQELRAVYVCANVARQGLGSILLEQVEKKARELGLSSLKMHSSITAVPFYKHHGYSTLNEIVHTLGTGAKMTAVEMRKDFS